MLEYFAYKKYKKNKAEKSEKAVLDTEQDKNTSSTSARRDSPSKSGTSSALATPLLNEDDERFLQRLTSPEAHHDEDEGPRPPLPPRVKTPDLTWDDDSESFRRIVEGAEGGGEASGSNTNNKSALTTTKDKGKAVVNRVSVFLRSKTTGKGDAATSSSPSSKLAVPDPDVDREKDDLTRVLDELNLAARNNKAFALSSESSELVRKFTLVLKDLVNGVPTAVNDLTSLLDDKDGDLSKNFDKLPSSLKKLVKQLPEKLSDSLAPELLATAAAAQGMSAEEAAAKGGIKGAAKRLLLPKNLKELVTKPGAIVSMLKGIMNALKLRWPAFMGTNVIWSLALFLLMFVLWYCHKRGREVRLDKEKAEAAAEGTGAVDGSGRIEELPDDPALPPPSTTTTAAPIVIEPPRSSGGERRRSSHRRSGSGGGGRGGRRE